MNDGGRARFQELGERVLGPLVLGGAIHPVRPFGAKLALAIEPGFRMADSELESRVGVARVRQARLLAPVDVLEPPAPEEWSMAAALNDLVQASNHDLSGVLTRSRHRLLLENLLVLAGRVSPPRTAREALARHATFARVLEVVRKDVRVSWWTGSAHFRGREVSGRLLAWPELRRVHTEEQGVGIAEMAEDLPQVPKLSFEEALRALLALTPLTDVGTAARRAPEFVWSPSTLALVASNVGAVLARRAVGRAARSEVRASIARATERLTPGTDPHRVAAAFLSTIEGGSTPSSAEGRRDAKAARSGV